jgi:hypothetical protein
MPSYPGASLSIYKSLTYSEIHLKVQCCNGYSTPDCLWITIEPFETVVIVYKFFGCVESSLR